MILVCILMCATPGLASCQKSKEAIQAMAATPAASADKTAATSAEPTAVPRKLIRTGELAMEVKSYEQMRPKLEQLLAEAGGHVANTRTGYAEDRVAWASVQVRIPAERFDATVAGIKKLGRVTSENMATQDITEAYADLAARLANARRLEARLQEIVAQIDNVKDLLATEQELARVRENIEVLEARQRVFDNQVALSTLDLELRLEDSPIAAPTFGSNASGTLSGSWAALAAFGRGALLVTIALLPWLPLIIGLLFGVRYWFKRRARAAA